MRACNNACILPFSSFLSPLYRSTPCPQVKSGDEWGDPVACEAGENCQYCHTRTEQQFHPEIYKSTKCNDIQNTSYCPRGAFCAFAHVERKSGGMGLFCTDSRIWVRSTRQASFATLRKPNPLSAVAVGAPATTRRRHCCC